MSNAHFILSSRKPWRATYRTQDGQVIYKAEATMPALGARDIKILKVVPTEDDDEEQLRDSFANLATVEYRTIHSSRIRMGDLDVDTSEYFRKVGDRFKFLGRDRHFTGPDGKEYLWRLGRRRCKLFLNDSAKTLVARYHRRGLDVIGDAPVASLEIFAPGKDMIDLIVVTGAYMEKLRHEKD